jgi:predicted nucleotidyltransferase
VKTVDEKRLDEITNRLAHELHPEGIWLFGSYAWGTPDEGSDL